MKFRKKPVVIEAIQWHPPAEWGCFQYNTSCGRKVWNGRKSGVGSDGVEYNICDVGIRTASGFAHLEDGDWICKQHVNGKEDAWPCKADIFAATYKAAE